jgi:nitrite reductase/ring-hydroxylating ferredoxin subunit
MPFVKIASVGEVMPGTAKQITVQGRTLGLFNVNGSFFAIDDTCTHRGAPLSEGECEGNEVTCPWHGARFSLETGLHLSPPAPRGVTSYKVQVVGDEVQVELP